MVNKKIDFKNFLRESIESGKPVIFDGGMGTMIQASGLQSSDYAIPEDLNLDRPDIIKKIHRKYLDAGANVLTANTFGANPLKLSGSKYSCREYIEAAVKLMKEAVDECESDPESYGHDKKHFIAWDTGQIGRLLEPMGDLTFDQAYEAYKEAVVTAEKAGAELAIIETMSDLHEMKAAILAVQENTNLAVVATPTFQENLRTLTGADVLTCVTYLESLHVDVLGFNCGGSLEEDAKLADQFLRYSHTPVLIQPNAGIPVVVNGIAMYRVSAKDFAEFQLENRKKGAVLLGGCCGTTPAHIGTMAKLVRSYQLEASSTNSQLPTPNSILLTTNSSLLTTNSPLLTDTYICSYNKTVQIGGNAGPKIVGERINPTGKKKVKAALQAHDLNFILSEAESQIQAGAQILDVNVGLPGIDEAAMMEEALKTIQGAFNVPLQLDSSEKAALEKGLRAYNGKALINSVNGRQDVMDAIFPLVKHYGGAVVALCIDEKGIAPTAEGRANVARKIIKEAAKYGIPVRDIVIDTLTLTVSSQQKEALETVRAIELLKKEFGSQGLKFILGVSNISFGLPRRDIINSRFFTMALYAGLDACIINPLSKPMMESYDGYRALAGFDENCLDYIESYTGTTAPVYGISAEEAANFAGKSSEPQKKAESPENQASSVPDDADENEKKLIEIINKGFKDFSGEAAKKLLEGGKSPVEIINRCIVPALDIVGKDFEKGRKFLPQLLLAAETVGNAFAIIKAHLEATGVKQESRGTIAIATVFGDIHDIGKNITKALLENYGYTVIDLGKNVPAETIVETVIKHNIKLVGLSALMTTTVGNMEKTIELLHNELGKIGRTCKIMAGGAVLTADYATKIGADYYAKDAMTSIAIAKEVFG